MAYGQFESTLVTNPEDRFSRDEAHMTDQSKDIWAASRQNQQNGMCAQQRLRSAWASAQFDQSLRCALSG